VQEAEERMPLKMGGEMSTGAGKKFRKENL